MENKQELRRQLRQLLDEKTPEELLDMVQRTEALMAYYRCAILEVETKFRVLNEQLSLARERNPIESIKSRLKSFDSIRDKLRRKGFPMNPETMEAHLSDVAGVRVICSFTDDIYMLSDCLLQQDDVTLISKKDYIQNPKENGYRSLHLIVEIPIFLVSGKKHVRVEVQLRTIAMESWANLEHRLRYKKALDESLLARTADLLNQCAVLSGTLDQKMQAVRDMIESK